MNGEFTKEITSDLKHTTIAKAMGSTARRFKISLRLSVMNWIGAFRSANFVCFSPKTSESKQGLELDGQFEFEHNSWIRDIWTVGMLLVGDSIN